MTAVPGCAEPGCGAPATCDLHAAGRGCCFLCDDHAAEAMESPNWTRYELGAHPLRPTPVFRRGWMNQAGQAVEIDGSPARVEGWRP